MQVHVELHNPGDVSPGFFCFYRAFDAGAGGAGSVDQSRSATASEMVSLEVAQWKSNGFVNRRLQVRILPASHNEAGYWHQVTAQVGGVADHEASRPGKSPGKRRREDSSAAGNGGCAISD